MTEVSNRPAIFGNRLSAAIGVVLTAFVTVQTFRDAFLHPTGSSHWFFQVDWASPRWAMSAMNAAFYVYLIWLGFAFFRTAQGRERVVVVGWFIGIVLYPVKVLAVGPALLAVEYVEAAAMAVALFAISDIFLRLLSTHKVQA